MSIHYIIYGSVLLSLQRGRIAGGWYLHHRRGFERKTVSQGWQSLTLAMTKHGSRQPIFAEITIDVSPQGPMRTGRPKVICHRVNASKSPLKLRKQLTSFPSRLGPLRKLGSGSTLPCGIIFKNNWFISRIYPARRCGCS